MGQKYAYQGDAKQSARALGKSLPISTKQSVEVCKAIKGKSVSRARTMLEEAIDKKGAIKFTRFTEGAGHKSGMGSGKYPVKACTKIVQVLNSAEANAQDQGLGADLVVEHAVANQGSRNMKYGRHARRKNKSTHVEIVVREATSEEKDKTQKKDKKKSSSKKKDKKNKSKQKDKKNGKKDSRKEKGEQFAGSKASSKKSDGSGDKSSASKGSSGKQKSGKKSGKKKSKKSKSNKSKKSKSKSKKSGEGKE